ncbi:hypothetical protein HanRHA438_Chr04g0167701 [Helianthus annuus]|nr:hypothetical protein HanRHA438_Chr04g0167701 [Helianthus annuus]
MALFSISDLLNPCEPSTYIYIYIYILYIIMGQDLERTVKSVRTILELTCGIDAKLH